MFIRDLLGSQWSHTASKDWVNINYIDVTPNSFTGRGNGFTFYLDRNNGKFQIVDEASNELKDGICEKV